LTAAIIAIRGRWKLGQAAKKKITPEPNHWKNSKWFRPHGVTVSRGSVEMFFLRRCKEGWYHG